MKKAFIISLGCEDRLKIIKKVLQNQYSCRIFISDFDRAKKQYITKKDPECEYIHVPEYKKNLSVGRINAYRVFANKVDELLKLENPDLVYIMLPPNYIAYKCALYREKHEQSKLIVDVYDLWPESFPIQKASKYFPLIITKWKKYRSRTLNAADFIFTECRYYRKVIGSGLITDSKTAVLYIHKDQTDSVRQIVKDSIDSHRKEKDKITFGYLGSINNIIDIEGIKDLVQKIVKEHIKVTVEIIGGGEGTEHFVSALLDAGACVNNHGFIFDEIEKAEILTNCDFGLNMMIGHLVVGLTTKSVDYFSLGLPIVNTIKEDTEKLVTDRNIGVNYTGDISQIIEMDTETIREMKISSYQCYQDLMTSKGLYITVHDALNENGII